MKVLVNATDGPLSVRAVQRYVAALARGLAHRRDDFELHLLFLTHHGWRVRRFLKGLGPEARRRVHWIPLPRAWTEGRYASPRAELLRIVRKVDLYHETTVDHPDVGGEVPVVTTVHGLAPLVRPDLMDPRFVAEKNAWFARALERSTHYLPVSETTRDEFLDRFDVPAERVRAVPLGVDASFTPGNTFEARRDVSERLSIGGNYLLYVGGVQRNKNIPRVLETARILRDRGVFAGDLILAGDVQYPPAALRTLVAENRLEGRVRTTGYLDPGDPFLVTLYRGASLFLFPTYYEGWTSPPLEAMGCGCPVIASRASSVPETVGEAAELADPDDSEAWVEAATRVLEDQERRDELFALGEARARYFSWDRMVAGTVDFYRAITTGELDAVAEAATVASS